MYFSLSSFTTLAVLAVRVAAQVGSNCDITGTYTVASGDVLNDIATDNGVTVDQILFVNPDIENPNFISPGQVIQIPDTRCVAPEPAPIPVPFATCVKSGQCSYVVVSGDTMTIIANEKLGITLDALVKANPQVTNIDALEINQVLNVPVCEGSKKPKKSHKKQPKKTARKQSFRA